MEITSEDGRKGSVAPVIFFCFLLSGLSSLIYEVLWMRLLILIFGSTTFAISTVLTAFMGGLALGSFVFGRFIDRSRHPVPIYGTLEAGIGIYALLVPTIFPSLIPLYQRVWQIFHISFYLFSLMQFLLVTPEKFDVIISEPSNPWMAGVSNLFTREFFIMGSQKLKPAGVFCQWLQLYKISPENLRSILQTFHGIFPHLLVFQSSEYDLLILGSLEPLSIDPGKLRDRLSKPRVKEDLGRIQVKSVRDILAHFVFGTREVPAFVQNAPINTDDNALLEFSTPRTLYIDTSEANFKELPQYSRGATIYLRH